MYTNTIIGSYNAIANSEHSSMIMKPPIKRQPKKSNSKESTRGNSEDSLGGGGGDRGLNRVIMSPEAPPKTTPSIPIPIIVSAHPEDDLPGLDVLLPLSSVDINPDQIFSPEVKKMGFTIDTCDGGGVLKCLPSESASSRCLLIQTLEGQTILQVNTQTPYCCSWYKNLEAKVLYPDGSEFGTIEKTAFGACKCSRRFLIQCHKNQREKVHFEVEILLAQPDEFLIMEGSEVVGKVTSTRLRFRTNYRLTFTKPDLCPNLKAICIVFAIFLHIGFAEKLNTCLGMCLCCCAGSTLATWILCVSV